MTKLAAIARLTEIDWIAMEDQEWFSYSYDEGRIIHLPAELPLVRRGTSGPGVPEGGRLEFRPKYRENFAHRGVSIECAPLVWRRYLSAVTDVTSTRTLKKQNVFIGTASPIRRAAMCNVEASARCLPPILWSLTIKKTGRWVIWLDSTKRSDME